MYEKILFLEMYAIVQKASDKISPIYLVDEFIIRRCLFLMLLNEMRILGESNVLPFLFLVLIKGMQR